MKKKWQVNLLLIIVIILVAGCSTSVRMVVMRPAEVNMAGAKRIAIMDFGYPPEQGKTLSYKELWNLLILQSMGVNPSKKQSIQERIAKYATDKVITVLKQTDYFDVISPISVSQAIQDSGMSAPNPIEIGQMVDAQAIIVGDITRCDVDIETSSKKFTKKDPDTEEEYVEFVDYVKRTLSIQLTYRAVNTTTGEIMATKTFKDSNVKEIEQDKKKNLPDQEEVLQEMVNKMMPKIARQIAPYKIVVYRTLMSDETKNPDMEKADEFVKNNIFDNALKIYLDVWKTTQNPAAGVNASIMYEALGDLDGAIQMAKEVVDATANPTAMREYNRLQKEKKLQEEVSEQME
ncbi:MAG: hypothetical protein JW969_15740 [Spirochaetales bacterium]|nr:hypothetical protein [Spirochaetales bacterium]